MPSAFSKSIPLVLSSGANIAQSSIANENFFAYEGGRGTVADYPSVSNRFHNSLTKTSTANDSAIGSHLDTFYTDPVGTSTGSTLNSGSTTTTLYQMTDSDGYGHYGTSNIPNKPVAMDSNGDIWEMDSTAYTRLGVRLAEIKNTNDYPGTFYLSNTQPSSDYRKWIDNVFQDTRADNNTVTYHIWQRESMTTPPSASSSYTLKLKDSDQHHLQEMTLLQMQTAMGEIILAGEQSTGIGDYQLRSATQGAPTDAGTWVAKGIAVDTRNVVDSDAQYATQYTSPYYTSQYTRAYTGFYSRQRESAIPSNFAGFRPALFAGSRNYAGQYGGSRNFLGQSLLQEYSGPRTYSDQYAGVRTFSGNYSGTRTFASAPNQYAQLPTNYAGSREAFGTFAGDRQTPGNFAGARQTPGNFVGQRNFVGARNFIGPRQSYFSGNRPALFAGDRTFFQYFAGSRNFLGQSLLFEYSSPSPFQFSGTRTSPQQNFSGNRTSAPTNFSGSRPSPGFFAGNRFYTSSPTQYAAGPYGAFFPTIGGYYAGSRSYSANYSGTRQVPGNFTGTREVPGTFTGTREVPGTFAGNRQVIYGGTRNYAGQYGGNRTFSSSPTEYLGVTPGDFLGPRNYQFIGDRTFTGDRNFSGTRPTPGIFSGTRPTPGQFTGSRFPPAQFAGTRIFSGSRTRGFDFSGDRDIQGQFAGSRSYTGVFSGSRNYADQYGGSRNYSSNPTQYLGTTAGTFAGARPVQYTGQYTGYYTSQYTGQFTFQYTENYTGPTLSALTETIETFTLYRKIAV